MYGLKELLQDCNSGRCQPAGALEAEFARQILDIASQNGDRIGKARKTGIAADFADRAQNANGAELLEDVGVAEDGGLDRLRLVAGLMLPEAGEDAGDFPFGELHLAEDAGDMGTGVSHVIPMGEFFRIIGAMTDKDAEIVQPGSGSDNFAVMGDVGADQPGQFDQPGLMPEFIHRAGLGFDEMGQPIKDRGTHDTFVIFRKPFCRGRIPGMQRHLSFGYRFVTFFSGKSSRTTLFCYCRGSRRWQEPPKTAKLLYRA